MTVLGLGWKGWVLYVVWVLAALSSPTSYSGGSAAATGRLLGILVFAYVIIIVLKVIIYRPKSGEDEGELDENRDEEVAGSQ